MSSFMIRKGYLVTQAVPSDSDAYDTIENHS